MKTSTILKYILLGIFNALMFYVVPLAISYESWFLLLIIGINTFLINITYITNKLIANSSTLQDLSLLVDKNTRIKLYNISVFGASSGRIFSSQQKYTYDKDSEILYDNRNNVACTLGDRGNFICGGESVDPGWRINVGTENYQRIVDDQRFRGPLSTVAKWTFQFAFFSVVLAFIVGLLLAITLNNEKVRFQKLYRSIYIIPYAIPAFISILVFRGLLNPDFGLVNDWLDPLYQLFNIEPIRWFRTEDHTAIFLTCILLECGIFFA